MRLGYIIKEGFSGLRKATLSSVVAITIISVALSLLGIFLIITTNITGIIEDIRSRVELEVFLDKSLNDDDSRFIGTNIRAIEGVDEVRYISKEEAALILKDMMGADDLFSLVGGNPLPASFKIKVKPEYRTSTGVTGIAEELGQMDGVEEISYQKELLAILDERVETYHYVSLGLGALAALAAILLVSNTIKLSIYSNRDLIKSMKLVGAKNSFIAGPYIMEGLIQGLLGSALACGFCYGIVKLARRYVLDGIVLRYEVLGIVGAFGIFLGILGSMVAIRFFLKERISDM